ncbi:hypothetical protein [Limosilactobacillus sp.]|uniref:hypothetical protein n=1 Tax=Limosilactobacillus sp. TaxID=2773925 RepID=UPI0025BDF1D3|nr:hypothetical protein [Limosilactobacillus sp.]MCH3923253.1 hypothetical protein [Limosilactobacillus sp.]MCH3927935.1 hypothetical protein [Limosilactobacillus sp.]
MKVDFYQAGCKSFFKKHSRQVELIRRRIAAAIDEEQETGMTKVKLASRQRVAGHPVYEFRLNLGKIGSARVAFTIDGEQVTVYFISSQLQKSSFSHDVERILANVV